MKKAVLVGASTPLDTAFLENERGNFLVACDAGYMAFLERGMEPDLLVADFDTLPRDLVRNPREVIRLNTVKDDTDVFFALKLLIKRGFDTFAFYGCLGGRRIEHEIANLVLLSYLKERDLDGVLYTNDGRQEIFLMKDEERHFHGEHGFLSLFSQRPETHVTEKGLKYELDDFPLSPTIPLGVSNEFVPDRDAFIAVRNGSALVIKERKHGN